VSEAEKEAARRRRLQQEESEQNEGEHDVRDPSQSKPTGLIMGHVHQGGAFGEAECVLDEPFQTSATATARHHTTVIDSSDAAGSHVDTNPTVTLLALSMEDYLRLWPKRAKLVQRACWLHKSVRYLNHFDRTEMVRIFCSAQVQEERVKVGTVVCQRGCVADKLHIIMSGGFAVERWVQVDKGVNEVMRTRGNWLGPTDDWGHPQTAQNADLTNHGEAVDAPSDAEEAQETQHGAGTLGIGVLDKSRAARALRRVVGFAGLSSSEHGAEKGRGSDFHTHKQRAPKHLRAAKGADSGGQDKRLQVKLDLRHLEACNAFGFWHLEFGVGEPGDVVARMESVVLTIPAIQFAKLLADARLRNSFVADETALMTVWNEHAVKLASVKRAQLLGRITAAQERVHFDHLAGMEQEVPGIKCPPAFL
jgi:hypothetical protein